MKDLQTAQLAAQVNVQIHAAQPTDAGSVGEILYQFQQNTPWMPKLYAEVEVIAFCGVMIDRGWVRVAKCAGQIQGFIARDGAEICSLYLAPGACGLGIGRALVDQAKAAQIHLWLRAFVANEGARRFYQREGFVEISQGDGSNNEEGLPDIRFEWHQSRAPEGQA